MTDLIVRDKTVGTLAIVAPWDQSQVAIVSTMAPDDTIRIKSSAERLETIGDKPILVTDVIVHMIEMPDADGELQAVARIILVTPEKRGYAAISKGVYDSLKDLAYLRQAPPPWNPPIKVQLTIQRTSKGYRVYRLVPAK